eukprot:GFYU01011520.1.p1 GENE.GFYU01011520.1~~GFYU01011520.1.p1  ORF type:complete len:512 (-),score=87.65 GFYU01011520.1:109-1644(-)
MDIVAGPYYLDVGLFVLFAALAISLAYAWPWILYKYPRLALSIWSKKSHHKKPKGLLRWKNDGAQVVFLWRKKELIRLVVMTLVGAAAAFVLTLIIFAVYVAADKDTIAFPVHSAQEACGDGDLACSTEQKHYVTFNTALGTKISGIELYSKNAAMSMSNSTQVWAVYAPHINEQMTVKYRMRWLHQLSDLGFNILTFDYPGYGESQEKVPTEEDVYDSLSGAIHYLRTVRYQTYTELHLIGRGVGATAVVSMAEAAPIFPSIMLREPFPSYATALNNHWPMFGWLANSIMSVNMNLIGKLEARAYTNPVYVSHCVDSLATTAEDIQLIMDSIHSPVKVLHEFHCNTGTEPLSGGEVAALKSFLVEVDKGTFTKAFNSTNTDVQVIDTGRSGRSSAATGDGDGDSDPDADIDDLEDGHSDMDDTLTDVDDVDSVEGNTDTTPHADDKPTAKATEKSSHDGKDSKSSTASTKDAVSEKIKGISGKSKDSRKDTSDKTKDTGSSKHHSRILRR